MPNAGNVVPSWRCRSRVAAQHAAARGRARAAEVHSFWSIHRARHVGRAGHGGGRLAPHPRTSGAGEHATHTHCHGETQTGFPVPSILGRARVPPVWFVSQPQRDAIASSRVTHLTRARRSLSLSLRRAGFRRAARGGRRLGGRHGVRPTGERAAQSVRLPPAGERLQVALGVRTGKRPHA